MSPVSFRAAVFAGLATLVASGDTDWTFVGKFPSSTPPGYAFLVDVTNDGELDLIVNGFSPFKAGAVTLATNASSVVEALRQGTNVSAPEAIFTDLFWPNWAERAPQGIFETSTNTTLIVPDGFLLPGSTPGGVYALNLAEDGSVASSYSLTGGKKVTNYDLFYGLAETVALRGDGTYDVLATRVRACAGGLVESGSLVLLTRPEDPNQDVEWEQTTLADDVDFAFVTREFEGAGGARKLALFTGSFSESKLSYYVADLSTFPPTLSDEVVVDADAGPIYSTQLEDINGDGVDELLVSNHEMIGTKGAVYAYELPADPTEWQGAAGNLTRHTLSSNFTLKVMPGEAAPGFPIPYYPSAAQHSGPKSLIVQGDNNGYVYQLTPLADDFTYERTELGYFGDPVGMPALADVDGDGFLEMFVPDYANDLVHVYTTADA